MSGDRYKIIAQNSPYFLTLTVVDWIDVFTRKEYRHTIVDSLIYCQQQKGLVLYGWCLMSNHLHIIAKAAEGCKISEILRDFKKFTAKKIITQMNEIPESRRDWMLYRFENAGRHLKRIKQYKFWKDDNYAIILENHEMMKQKLEYIHANPVVAEIVTEDYEYKYSSAKYYANEPTEIECEKL
jgi:REP element-mobilizing transposase RayT